MNYTAEGMSTFLATASDRMSEDSEDIKAFCDFLTAVTAREKLFVQYAIPADTLVTETPIWSFEVINKKVDLRTRFFVSLIQDIKVAQRLIEDPYFMDISTWLPADIISKMGCSIENTLVDPVTQEMVPIKIIDNPLGFYTDPCRPLTWLITEQALEGKATTIQEATLELFAIWEFVYLNPYGIPEKPESNPLQIKSAGHLRLATLDGKLVDHS